MSPAEEGHLSPAEVARRMGVSAKALRLYEARGLLKPLRSQAGWRTYGKGEIARLHHILALKRLGLPLARIEELLSRRGVSLERVLAVQEDALSREQTRVSRALAVVRSARGKLAAGQTLSIDDLIQLTKETTMTTQQQRDEMKAIFDPIIDKHYTDEERAELRTRSYDQAEVSGTWDGLMAEARTLMVKGDPGSPEAKDLARRWKAQVNQFTGGNPEIAAKAKAVWKEAMADPKTAPKLPLNPEIFAFIEKAWKAAGEADTAAP
ncbi:MAG TPA: MerR family transcriptional regulator [Rhizomicrobium sp.]|nr:MerR family transcriptional regulator [Rhizomicrobium sp.]